MTAVVFARSMAAVVLVFVLAAPVHLGADAGVADSGVLDQQFVLDQQLDDAVSRGNLSAVKRLIAAGANPNAAMDGYPVLQSAVREGTVEIVEFLITVGADVNGFGVWVPGCCQDRDTALHQAVRYWSVCVDGNIGQCSERRQRILQILLAAGADVSARDKLVGATPLELAERLGFTDVMDILIRAGAEPNAR